MELRSGAAGLLVPIALGLAGCGEAEAPATDDFGFADELHDGRTFLSTSVVEGDAPRPLAEGTRIRLEVVEGDLSVEAGCNALWFGNATQEGDRLITGLEGTTEIGCSPERIRQDDWLTDFLTSEPTLRLNGDSLRLTSGDTTIDLLDIEVADPDRPLVGTRWRINTVVDGQSANSFAEEAEAYLTFGDDGTISGRTACNSFSARYEVDGPRLSVSRLIATDASCKGYAAEIQAALFDVLHGDSIIDIETDQLSLTAADGKGVSLRTL